jgi:hypothetical protein
VANRKEEPLFMHAPQKSERRRNKLREWSVTKNNELTEEKSRRAAWLASD